MNEDNNNLFDEYKKLVKVLGDLEKDSRESPIPSLEAVSYIFERNARIIAKRLLNDYLSGNCGDSSFISQCAYELTSAFSLGWIAHSSNKFTDIPINVESCEDS